MANEEYYQFTIVVNAQGKNVNEAWFNAHKEILSRSIHFVPKYEIKQIKGDAGEIPDAW